MKRPFTSLSLAVIFLSIAPGFAKAQSSDPAPPPIPPPPPSRYQVVKNPEATYSPFSQFALGVGFGAMGVNLQVSTNVDRYLNLRVSGNVLDLSVDNISTNGFNVNADMGLSSAGLSLDYFPFPRHGWRLSPGILFHNDNAASATLIAQPGTSFTLNNVNYYSSSASPVEGNAHVGFNDINPAFTLTTGWGNAIPRKGGHFSFPFEIGAAFVGTPTVNIAITQGVVCDASGVNCADVTKDPTFQSNLQAQIAKYRNDLNPLKVYPILSGGVSYRFGVRQ